MHCLLLHLDMPTITPVCLLPWCWCSKMGIWAQRITPVSEDGTQWFFTKDVWSLAVLQDALHHTTHQWYGKYINQVLALSEWYLIAVIDFFPLQIFPYSVYGSNASTYEKENENVLAFLASIPDFFEYVHRHTEIIKWGRLSHCLLCAFLWFNGFSSLNTIELKISTIGTWTPIWVWETAL